MSLPVVLIGAGGHAKVALDILLNNRCDVTGFVDPIVNQFFDLTKQSDSDLNFNGKLLGMGLGGMDPKKLFDRLNVFHSYKSKGAEFTSIISSSACVSKLASLGEGVFVNNGAVINGPSNIGSLAIINTRAIIEHDVVIEEGAHIAPGAIILGHCHIGKNSMIGAGAVVLPGHKVPDNSLVPALTRYPKKS